MSNIFFDGTLGPVSGSTEFGIYDNDAQFIADAPRVANWCARRLGYPVVSLELQDKHLYNSFETAVNEYSALINEQNIQDNLYDVKGLGSNIDINNTNVNHSSKNLFAISKEYGRSVLGANSEYPTRTGYITTQAGIQVYDLNSLYRDVNYPGDKLIIRKIFHKRKPAQAKMLDPFAAAGMGFNNVINEFGFDGQATNAQYLLSPLHDDILRMNQIEMSDTIRKSAYSFKIDGNKLRIFPIPVESNKLWFEYQLQSELDETTLSTFTSGSIITDASNIPYQELKYSSINNVGKQWIKKYTLACVKETLGMIRSKFGSIPVSDGDVILDGDTLRSEASEEKRTLEEEMRTVLEKTGRRTQMEVREEVAESVQAQLKKYPKLFYVR